MKRFVFALAVLLFIAVFLFAAVDSWNMPAPQTAPIDMTLQAYADERPQERTQALTDIKHGLEGTGAGCLCLIGVLGLVGMAIGIRHDSQ